MMERFWMVLIDGTRGCSYKHLTIESARAEAERLLRLSSNIGRGATIIEAVEYGRIVYPPVIWSPVAEGMYKGEGNDRD